MNKRILLLASSISMLLAIHQAGAQTLGGSYTVGVGMDYPTLTSAIAAYNSSTLTGPVVLNLTDLEYQFGETYPITINHNSTASNVNTLTIKPALGNTSCTIKGTGQHMFVLNGSEHVIFDGSHDGSNSKNLIIYSDGGFYHVIFLLTTPTDTDGANYNQIRNCIIDVFIYFGEAAIYSGSPWLFGSGGFCPSSYNRIENNELRGNQTAIIFVGESPSNPDLNNSIINNTVGSADRGGERPGISLSNQDNAIVKGNEIQNICGFDGGNGIQLNATRNSKVLGNKIHNFASGGFTGYGPIAGIYINSYPFNNSTSPSQNLVANNVIYNLQRWWYGTVTGIYFQSGYNDKILYNSILLDGQLGFNGEGSSCFKNDSEPPSLVEVRNNAFYLGGHTPNSTANMYVHSTHPTRTNYSGHNIDHNAYYVSLTGPGVGFIGAINQNSYNTLPSWQTVSGVDANSININPQFSSPSDLTPMDGSPLDEAGTPVPEITTDFNGNPRSPDFPTIGAYELGGACDLTASAGVDAQSYYGYSPSQCVIKTASTSGGEGPFTYSWTIDRPLTADETITGASTATVSVCLISPANLCLTVTDNNNCTVTDCAMINAEDVRCIAGNSGNHKVTVCHNGHNICVDYNAVPAHLAHGDYIGNCVTTQSKQELQVSGNEESLYKIFPNPAHGDFFIQLTDVSASPVSTMVRIINANGQVVKQFIMQDQLAKRVSINNPGLYLIQFIQGNKVYSKKLVIAE